MLLRTVAAASIILGLVGTTVSALPSQNGAATHLIPGPHNADGQVHLRDSITCFNDVSFLNGEENSSSFPTIDCDPYGMVPGAAAEQFSDSVSSKGNRVASSIEWAHPAFSAGADAAIADNTVVGGVRSVINIDCDDAPDYLFDETTPLPIDAFYDPDIVPEPVREQTTAWGVATGEGGSDERFIADALPAAFVPYVRYRADVDFVTQGLTTGVHLASPISLNVVRGGVPWSEMTASYELLGGNRNAPSAQLVLCQDGVWIAQLRLGSAALLTNPPSAGVYPRWRSYASEPGTRDEQLQRVSYITYCKHVGGVQLDADNDCWPDTLDNDDSFEDQDNDGLLDGIDLAWIGGTPCLNGGLSPVNTADCDGDGRTDLEEHFSVTDPRSPDTDGDGMLDAGLHLDCNGDGEPDMYGGRGSVGPHSGRNRMHFGTLHCLPSGGDTMLGGLGGRPWGNLNAASEDNCPLHAGPQTNTSTAEPDLDLLPVPGDSNGRFVGPGDATHPDAHYAGDICDSDDDNDGVPDAVEGSMYYDASGTSFRFCNVSNVGVPAVTLQHVRDTDGDGSIDGVECMLGKNPADPSSKPGTTMTLEQQVYFRLRQLTQNLQPMIDDLDDGSTIGGVAESRGQGPGGGSSNDVDRDGCVDEVETVDVDGTRVATIADSLAVARAALGVSSFAPAGSTTAEEIRTADVDFNGSIGIADRLAAARIVLTASLPSIPDYNLNCKAAAIGFDAN